MSISITKNVIPPTQLLLYCYSKKSKYTFIERRALECHKHISTRCPRLPLYSLAMEFPLSHFPPSPVPIWALESTIWLDFIRWKCKLYSRLSYSTAQLKGRAKERCWGTYKGAIAREKLSLGRGKSNNQQTQQKNEDDEDDSSHCPLMFI